MRRLNIKGFFKIAPSFRHNPISDSACGGTFVFYSGFHPTLQRSLGVNMNRRTETSGNKLIQKKAATLKPCLKLGLGFFVLQ
jgi:hypothetical protein